MHFTIRNLVQQLLQKHYSFQLKQEYGFRKDLEIRQFYNLDGLFFINLLLQYQESMKRIGSIYLRDISKSQQKIQQSPLREIKNNYKQPFQRKPNKWQSEAESNSQTIYKSTSQEYRDICFEADSREISFSGSQPQQHKNSRQQSGGQSQVVKKLKCVNSIINEIGALKSCSLKLSQSYKLSQIQDKLLSYERKLLQAQKQNYS